MISQERCEKLLKKVRKDFPILNNSRIIIKIEKMKTGSMGAYKKLFHYLLIIDPIKYNDATNQQISGALAHELMHFETYEKYGWKRYILEYFAYLFFKRLMTQYEKENDRQVIQRGYARELYANRAYRIKKISASEFKKIGACYLLPNEIKAYAKRIGKWRV
jgi:hypothetical protein